MSRLTSRKLGQRLRERNKQRALQFETFEERRLLAVYTPLPGAADGSAGSLRAAIQASNTNNEDDVIILGVGTYTISLGGAGDDLNGGGDFDILDTGNSVHFTGQGIGSTIISGNQVDRIFDIFSTVSVTLEDLTITGGRVTGSYDGGAIQSLGTLALIGVEVTGNTARDGGGLLLDHSAVITDSIISNNSGRNGGGIRSFAPLTLTNTVISGNTATSFGGGYNNDGAVNIFIRNTTFDDNSASVDGGGFINNGGRVHVLTDSTFSNNSAGGRGGGFQNSGGRFISVQNVTVSGNSAGIGGGIDNFGGMLDEVMNLTIVNNTATTGGGVQNEGGNVTVRNTIIANNSGNTGPDFNGKLIGRGYNLIENTAGVSFREDLTGNITGQEPDLGPLQDNGGLTETHELLVDSIGIDQGTAVGAPLADQRGELRPQGLTVDIGAFEAPPNGDFISPTATVVEIVADPRNVAVGTVSINFDEDVIGVNIADFGLTLGGNVVDISGLTVNAVSASSYNIDLSSVTTADGNYVLTLTAVGSGIEDLSGNLLLDNASDGWLMDATAPVADILDVSPDPTMTEVTSLTVNFSEQVLNLDLADFTLTAGGTSVDLLAGGATVTVIDTLNYAVNLNGLAAADGNYVLTLTANSGVADLVGNAVVGATVEAWTKDNVSPTGDIVDVSPDPRLTAVGVVQVLFDEDVVGVDLAAFTLLHDGAVLDLVGLGVTVNAVSGSEYEIDLTNVGGAEGAYALGLTGVVTDLGGNVLAGTPADNWDIDLTGPTPAIGGILPTLRNTQPSPRIVFDEPVTGFELADIVLRQDGDVVDLVAEGVTLVQLFGGYVLTLGGHNFGDGEFELNVDLTGVVDGLGNPVTVPNVSASWEIDATAPTADIIDVDPDPRAVAVDSVTITFDDDVTRVDLSDFVLDRDGTVLDLDLLGATLAEVSPSQYTLDLSAAGLTDIDGLYTLTLVAEGSRIEDLASNELVVDAVEVWRKDGGKPEADIVDISPDPRTVEVGLITVQFNEAVLNVDIADFALTLGGNAVDISTAPFTAIDSDTFQIDLTTFATADGTYVLTVLDTGGITDLSGSPLLESVSDTWFMDGTAPTVNIVDISPDPGTVATTTVTISFSEVVLGFGLEDLVLTRDNAPINLVTFGAELTQDSTTQYTLALLNLASLDGTYVLSINAATSGVQDPTGNLLAVDESDSWLLDATPPAADIVDISPDPRTVAVGAVFINFSEAVVGFSIAELSLTVDGAAVDISGFEVVAQSPTQYQVNLTGIATQDGNYVLTLSAGDITDVIGNALAVSVNDSWLLDATPPSVDITDVAPNPRQTAVPSVDITFSETVFNFDLGDLVLTVGGIPVDLQAGGATLAMNNNLSYTLNLNGLADGDGEFILTVNTNDVVDQIGNGLVSAATEAWSQDTSAPTVDIIDVTPDPRNLVVSDLTFQFSEPVTNFGLEDIFLTRDFITVVLNTAVLTEISPDLYELDLSGVGLSDVDGLYRVSVFDTNTGIADLAGNELVAGASDEWLYNGTPPVGVFPVFTPELRTSPVFGAVIFFNEEITGLGIEDFVLTLDGVPVDLVAAGGSVAETGINEYGVSVAGATDADGTYVLTLIADGSGVIDVFGNEIVVDVSVTWSLDRVSPLVDIIDVTPDPTATIVSEITIQFTESVSEFDIADLTLTSNGNNVDLAAAILTDNGGGTFLLDLGSLANGDANYVLSLNAGSEIVDLAGNPLASPMPVTDTWRLDAQSPQVVSVIMNADQIDPLDLPNQDEQPSSWTTQRSDIRSIVITFDDDVVLTVGDITLTNLGLDADNDPDTILNLDQSQVVVNGNVATISFVADEVSDGVYQLELSAAITDPSGNPLDGDGDGNGGDAYTLTGSNANHFYRLQTDWSGDGGVSVFDFTSFSYWFGQGIQSLGGLAPDYVDVSGDGGVSVFDFNPFSLQFGVGVRFPVALSEFVPLGNDAQGESIEEETLIEVAIDAPVVLRTEIPVDQRISPESTDDESSDDVIEDVLDDIVADIATFWSN